MVREKMSAEDIAAGWALGMFIGCSIPFGLQLIVSVPLAMMMRVSKIGATFGTLITNPVTIFFIYPAQTYLMNKVLFDGSLTFDKLMAIEWTFETVRQLGAEVMVSFFLGGLALSMIMTPITYFSVKWIVKRYRR
jgi:uncharacterized protein (DUF2062 family)